MKRVSRSILMSVESWDMKHYPRPRRARVILMDSHHTVRMLDSLFTQLIEETYTGTDLKSGSSQYIRCQSILVDRNLSTVP